MKPPSFNQTEFTLEELQQFPEKKARSLLAKRLSYAMAYTETKTRDYFDILSRYTGDHAAVWLKMVDVDEMDFYPDPSIFNSLLKYVKQHQPTSEMCQASVHRMSMAPEYLLLLFNNTALPVEPIDPLRPQWSRFEESLWDEISVAEMKKMIYHRDGSLSTVSVWLGLHPYRPADYCLAKATQHGRAELIKWLIRTCAVSWHNLDNNFIATPFNAFSTALAYKKVVKAYLIDLNFRLDIKSDRACHFIKTVAKHIEKDRHKWLLTESFERIRREMHGNDLKPDPTVERLYELCLKMPILHFSEQE